MDFDELIEVFDYIQKEKVELEVYISTDGKVAFILPNDEEIWLSKEDAVKFFVLIGKLLKSIKKVEEMKVTIEYKLT